MTAIFSKTYRFLVRIHTPTSHSINGHCDCWIWFLILFQQNLSRRCRLCRHWSIKKVIFQFNPGYSWINYFEGFVHNAIFLLSEMQCICSFDNVLMYCDMCIFRNYSAQARFLFQVISTTIGSFKQNFRADNSIVIMSVILFSLNKQIISNALTPYINHCEYQKDCESSRWRRIRNSAFRLWCWSCDDICRLINRQLWLLCFELAGEQASSSGYN
jgi:hypothetical protein